MINDAISILKGGSIDLRDLYTETSVPMSSRIHFLLKPSQSKTRQPEKTSIVVC